MNRDLLLAILAMDSYNRGYNQGLKFTQNSDNSGTAIGNAIVSNRSSSDTNSAAYKAGFYAIAYDWQGEKIISYRGTDGLIRDAITGYGIALGTAGTTQANLAIEF